MRTLPNCPQHITLFLCAFEKVSKIKISFIFKVTQQFLVEFASGLIWEYNINTNFFT